MAINDAVGDKYPNITEAMYLREPKDRKTVIKVRRELCQKTK